MTATSQPNLNLSSRLVKRILEIEPLANFAKSRARNMMIKRAEAIGVPWRENVRLLSDRNWTEEFANIYDPNLEYPDYYTTSFHAYPEGNLSWKAAWEVESAARSVHAKIWSAGDVNGDTLLRQSYHQILEQQVTTPPRHSRSWLRCRHEYSGFAECLSASTSYRSGSFSLLSSCGSILRQTKST